MTELSKEELKEIKESLTHISELPWCESPGDCIDEPAAVYRIEEDAIHTEIIADNMLGVNAKAVMVIMNASSKIFSTIESLSEQNKEQSKELERLKVAIYVHESYDKTVSELHEENVQLRNQLREAVEEKKPKRCDLCPDDDETCYCYEDKPVVDRYNAQAKELERLKGVCKMLIGEEVMFQEGKYETEMSKLRDKNISLCNQLREAKKRFDDIQEIMYSNGGMDSKELHDKVYEMSLNAVMFLSHIQGKEN